MFFKFCCCFFRTETAHSSVTFRESRHSWNQYKRWPLHKLQRPLSQRLQRPPSQRLQRSPSQRLQRPPPQRLQRPPSQRLQCRPSVDHNVVSSSLHISVWIVSLWKTIHVSTTFYFSSILRFGFLCTWLYACSSALIRNCIFHGGDRWGCCTQENYLDSLHCNMSMALCIFWPCLFIGHWNKYCTNLSHSNLSHWDVIASFTALCSSFLWTYSLLPGKVESSILPDRAHQGRHLHLLYTPSWHALRQRSFVRMRS